MPSTVKIVKRNLCLRILINTPKREKERQREGETLFCFHYYRVLDPCKLSYRRVCIIPNTYINRCIHLQYDPVWRQAFRLFFFSPMIYRGGKEERLIWSYIIWNCEIRSRALVEALNRWFSARHWIIGAQRAMITR